MRGAIVFAIVVMCSGCVAPIQEPEVGVSAGDESVDESVEECGGYALDDPDFECPEQCFREVPRVYDPGEGCTRRLSGAFCLSEIANNALLCGTTSSNGPFYEFTTYALPDGASWRECEEKEYDALREAPACDATE